MINPHRFNADHTVFVCHIMKEKNQKYLFPCEAYGFLNVCLFVCVCVCVVCMSGVGNIFLFRFPQVNLITRDDAERIFSQKEGS